MFDPAVSSFFLCIQFSLDTVHIYFGKYDVIVPLCVSAGFSLFKNICFFPRECDRTIGLCKFLITYIFTNVPLKRFCAKWPSIQKTLPRNWVLSVNHSFSAACLFLSDLPLSHTVHKCHRLYNLYTPC